MAPPSPDATTLPSLEEVQRRAWEEALDELDADGRALPVAAAAPTLPRVFAPLLGRALTSATDAERPTLVEYHARTLQRMRAEVVACADEPQRTLLHTPLDLVAMPRLASALERFFDLVAAAGVDPTLAFGAPSPAALLATRPTVAALFAGAYYGGYGPPLCLQATDRAALARELAAGAPTLDVIDRRLTGPLVHELSHLGHTRAPFPSPYLDECVAAWLGALAFPALAVPAPGDDAAMYMAAWFTQVGAHLARLFGQDALVRAHAGLVPWEDVLPPGLLATLERLAWEQWLAGRQLSFLGDTDRPDPWIKAFWLAAAGRLDARVTLPELAACPWRDLPRGPWSPDDDALLAWARHALATEPHLTPEGAWRVTYRPVETAVGGDGRVTRARVRYPLEFSPLHVIAPPGAPVSS